MEQRQDRSEPKLAPIKNGWAARGEGWAVHGQTREEAIQKFREAEQRHKEIDARPLWYERQDTQLIYEEHYTIPEQKNQMRQVTEPSSNCN